MDEKVFEGYEWYGSKNQTEEKQFQDPGKGETIDIRLEEYRTNPTLKHLPTAEEILTPEYLKALQAKLWGDGLRLVMKPRVSIDKEWIRVFAPCQANTGQSFLEQPKTIQEWNLNS